LASMAGDYIDTSSNTTSRKGSIIAGEGSSFITSLVKQHNGMSFSSPSRIRRFGNTGKTNQGEGFGSGQKPRFLPAGMQELLLAEQQKLQQIIFQEVTHRDSIHTLIANEVQIGP